MSVAGIAVDIDCCFVIDPSSLYYVIKVMLLANLILRDSSTNWMPDEFYKLAWPGSQSTGQRPPVCKALTTRKVSVTLRPTLPSETKI